MVNFDGLDLLTDTKNYNAISASSYTLNSSSFATPVSILCDVACFSISGDRQFVYELQSPNGTVLDRNYVGATFSATQHRFLDAGIGHSNMTAFVGVAASGDSAGYISTALPEIRLAPGSKIKVYDINSITNSDTVTFRVTYYGKNLQSYMSV